MLCERCEQEIRKVVHGLDQAMVDACGGRDGRELPSLVCVRCGSALPVADTADRMLRKLEELSRFGLAVDEDVLLDP